MLSSLSSTQRLAVYGFALGVLTVVASLLFR